MRFTSFAPGAATALALIAVPLSASLSAQQAELPADMPADMPAAMPADGSQITVTGMVPSDLAGMPAGPEIEGFISARKGEQMQITAADGTSTVVAISEASEIRSQGGFLGLDRDKLGRDALLNGLPVTVETVQWGNGLIASKIALKNKDLKTAKMIRTGTEQGFAEQTAATDALRSRVADIDQYNIKGTTNVYFDTGKWNLSADAEGQLCTAAEQAGSMDNALLLVVGYTDSTGDYDFNQTLSEKRATRVVNFLQQQCGWKPYRMLTPTGMAEADPAADNNTDYGKQQNRRVAVNILVSKSVDGL
jgi:OmpA-OmpF porin, OOP family